MRKDGIVNIYCAVTHGLFVFDSFEKLEKATTGVIISDSIVRRNAVPLVEESTDTVIIPCWQATLELRLI